MSAGRFSVTIAGPRVLIVDTEERTPTAAMELVPTDDAGADLDRAWAVVAILNDADLSAYDSREPF